MYCNNCGKELPKNAAFCSECGAKTIMPLQRGYANQGEYTDANSYANQNGYVQPNGFEESYDNKKKSGWTTDANMKIAGVLGGVMALLSLFLTWAKVSSKAIADLGDYLIGNNGSRNFFGMMEEEALLLGVLTIIAIALVIVFHLVNHPMIASLGYLWMIMLIAIFIETLDGSYGIYKAGFGFVLFSIGTILTVGAAMIRWFLGIKKWFSRHKSF